METLNSVRLFLVLPAGLVLLASIAFANPIGVSGSGTFTNDLEVRADSQFTVGFSGSNGIDSVSVHATCNSPLGVFAVSCTVFGGGSAVIDGLALVFPNGIFSFSLGGPNDFVSGHNNTGQFAAVSIIDSIQITSQHCVANAFCTGTFDVLPTPTVPEPGTGGFLFLGAGLIAFCGWRGTRCRVESLASTRSVNWRVG
jgi:hypothetical protein